jgi:Raf kinase inhibitor-like YbhB/YbcL family protein
MTLTLTSSVFEHGAEIPRKYTCQGDDVSPPLSWANVPDSAKSLVLIVDDPDAPDPRAPRMTWIHWLLYNLPPQTIGLTEDIPDSALPPGTLQGKNDWKRTGFGGPCPPVGRHRYFHKLYALDCLLPDLHAPTRSELEAAMRGHVIEQAELVGLYEQH